MGSWPCRLPRRMLQSFLAVMVGPLRLWSARPALIRTILARTALLVAPCFGLAVAACGLDLQGELVDRTDGGSSGLSASGSGSSGSGGGASSSGGSGSGGSGGSSSGSGGDDDSSVGRKGDGSTPPSSSGDDSGDADLGVDPDGAATRCDFSGTWATKLTIAVNWVPQGFMGVILAPGSGTIDQWIQARAS